MGSLVEVRRTWDLGEAICLKSFLESQDIYSFIQNEHHLTMTGGILGAALGGYRIVVASEDAQKAREILMAADAEDYSLGEDFDEGRLSSSLFDATR